MLKDNTNYDNYWLNVRKDLIILNVIRKPYISYTVEFEKGPSY